MISHYIDISVDEHLNAASLFGRLIYRIHGYCKARQDVQLAIDFPQWKPAEKVMAAQQGNVLRVFGTDSSLGDLLMKTGFMQFLVEGGIAFLGVRKIPDQVDSYVVLSRNYRIDRYAQLLADPSRIRFDEVNDAEIPDHIREISGQINMEQGLLFTMERLMEILHLDKKRCATIKMQSESSGKPFLMKIERDVVVQSESLGNFSTYGFSVEGACVPTW